MATGLGGRGIRHQRLQLTRRRATEPYQFVPPYIHLLQRIHTVHPTASIVLTPGPSHRQRQRPARSLLDRYLMEVQSALPAGRVSIAPTRSMPGDECDAHPTAAQHRIMADDIGRFIRRSDIGP